MAFCIIFSIIVGWIISAVFHLNFFFCVIGVFIALMAFGLFLGKTDKDRKSSKTGSSSYRVARPVSGGSRKRSSHFFVVPRDYPTPRVIGMLKPSEKSEYDKFFDYPGVSDQYSSPNSYKGADFTPDLTCNLKAIDSTTLNNSHQHGNPGYGLNSSDFSASRIQRGIAGEQRLAKMVQSLGFYNAGWESFWSLRASDAGDTDVDCVLVHGRDVYLIDAKNYSVNKNLYLTLANNYKQLLVVDSAGEVQYFKGGKDKYSMWRTYEISHNMSMAVDYYQRALPSWANIHAVVALCPTKDGIPGIKNRVEYQGAIPLVQSNAYLLELCKRHPDYAKADAAILSKLNELLKG